MVHSALWSEPSQFAFDGLCTDQNEDVNYFARLQTFPSKFHLYILLRVSGLRYSLLRWYVGGSCPFVCTTAREAVAHHNVLSLPEASFT